MHDDRLDHEWKFLQVVKYVEIAGRKCPWPFGRSIRPKQSDSSLAGSSDQKRRESKSALYRDKRYAFILEVKGIHLMKIRRRYNGCEYEPLPAPFGI